MTFANFGTLGALPGKQDELVSILVRSHPELVAAGCLLYEVGTHTDEPDTVFVMELWESAEAHENSLKLEGVRAAITDAMPLLSGAMSGHQFTVLGSPLPD